MPSMYTSVDGSRGEGGGQVIRTALALSCITGKSVSIRNIRHKRRVRGLRPQHVTAARILGRMCDGSINGDSVGSDTLEFTPGSMRDSTISVDVGTAGSIPLILQAAIPAAWTSGVRLDLAVTGGTDVRWSPTADYTETVMCGAYRMMGAAISFDVQRRGYYPRGGGRIRVRVERGSLSPARFTGRPDGVISVRCTQHEMDASGAVDAIAARLERAGHPHTTHIHDEEAATPGAAVLLSRMGDDHIGGTDSLYTDGFDQNITERLLDCTGVDENLADMLVIPASVAEGPSIFEVGHITKHLETALYVSSLITGCKYGISRVGHRIQVKIQGIG